MNTPKSSSAPRALTKFNLSAPVLNATGPNSLFVLAGTTFDVNGSNVEFKQDTPVAFNITDPGTDFLVTVDADGNATARTYAEPYPGNDAAVIGGGHFAPGGNAAGRSGGDSSPQINPFSLWDVNFRPACADARGMTLVNGEFWADIYLLGTDHLKDGTSRFGATIADGRTPPAKPDGNGTYDQYEFHWHAANEVFKHHGKTLLSVTDFFEAAFGVTEETSSGSDPVKTGLDAPRTSKWGLMQATGNLWTWGHDGDPDKQHAALFGGYWVIAAYSGSRASSWYYYPWYSASNIGARGRSDHLNLDHPAR